MLASSQVFKSSIWHEYEAVIEDFSARIDRCKLHYDDTIPAKDVLTTDARSLDLYGGETVDIVRLVCNTYAKKVKAIFSMLFVLSIFQIEFHLTIEAFLQILLNIS